MSELRMTPLELAFKKHCAVSTLQKLLEGSHWHISVNTLQQYADILAVDIAYLFEPIPKEAIEAMLT